MAAALRAEFREKSFVVLAHHLDDFIVGHGAIVSPPIPSAFAGVIRGTPVPSPGAMGRQRSQRFCFFLQANDQIYLSGMHKIMGMSAHKNVHVLF
jgi:hypothetical protein